MNHMNLAQKKVLMTGATGGIGTAFAKSFAERDCEVILVAPNENKLKTLKNKLIGNNHSSYTADFTKKDDIINLCELVIKEHKKIDILINNAGIGIYENLENIDPKDWFASYDINIHAPFIIAKLLLPSLMKSNNPHIINVGSVCGTTKKGSARTTRVAYNSTKFALRGLSLTMHEEFKNTKLKVTHLTLPSVMTSFGPLSINDKKDLQKKGKKYLQTEDVARKLIRHLENDKLKKELIL